MLRVIVSFICGYLCGVSLVGVIASGEQSALIFTVFFSVITLLLLILWANTRHKRKQNEFYKNKKFRVEKNND